MSERYEQHIEFSDRFDSVNEQVLMVVYDTLREVTTITFLTNTEGDTLRTDRVTDRQTNEVIVKTEKLSVVTNQAQSATDALLIADTVVVQNSPASPSQKDSIGNVIASEAKQSTRTVVTVIGTVVIVLLILLAIPTTCRLVTFLRR